MTDDEIRAEISTQLKILLQHGEVTIKFHPADEDIEGVRLCTDEAFHLDFTLTGTPKDGFVIFINQIGDHTSINELPRVHIDGNRILHDDIFIPDDHFYTTYKSNPVVVPNYSIYTEITEIIKPKSIFEIGVRAGYSAWAMLKGSPEALYRGLDLDQGTDGGKIGYSEHAKKMLPRWFPQADIRIVYGDSQSLMSLPRTYDLIHIDGAHGHNTTLRDLTLCALYSDRVLLDDARHIATVGSALAEFLAAYPVVKGWIYETWRGHVLLDTSAMKPAEQSVENPSWLEELM
jgi:hypothetical protein